MSEPENGKRKRKFNYTVMIFADSKEGRIRQLRIDPAVIESLLVVLLATIIILSVVSSRRGNEILTLKSENAKQAEEIQTLEEEKQELSMLHEELTQKVMILSDTINQKVEAEEEKEAEDAEAHMPTGFPMTSSASMQKVDTDEPMVKLKGSEGNSIVASGAGTILSITTDSSYLHCVRIDHGNGYVSIYRNDGEVMGREGDEVVRGSIIYVIGEENTELGYQITYNEKYMDPVEMFSIDG